MEKTKALKSSPSPLTLTDYDSNAGSFDRMRRPGQETLAGLKKVLAPAAERGQLLSIGCGTGQYEGELFDAGFPLTGLDRSEGMLALAKGRIGRCVRGDMATLPFRDGAFSGVFFIQSLHHMGASFALNPEARSDARKGVLREAMRVLSSGPVAIVQRDPSQNRAVWFWRYFPRALEGKMIIQPPVSQVAGWLDELGFRKISAKPLNDAMIRGFYEPEAPLDPHFRRSFSEFTYLSREEMDQGCRELDKAIASGVVMEQIEECRRRFRELGGTLFLISAEKAF
jgi:SAM-dependent methyltransferase